MPLRVYYDLLSQPSRAVIIFLKVDNIPFIECPLDLSKGEQRTEEYAKCNPFKKVPAIDDDGFKLAESITIMKYLAMKHSVPDHWYPVNLQRRARVDEYVDWHHSNTRAHGRLLFRFQMFLPVMEGIEPDASKVQQCRLEFANVLDTIEAVFLKNQNFVAGDEISIADLAAACELMQPGIAGFDLFSQRPQLGAWMERVRSQTNPHFDEAHSVARRWREEYSLKCPIAGEWKL